MGKGGAVQEEKSRREEKKARESKGEGEMAEDLVCKFPRCISVGSWRDPWRINGPALMKGRGRGG